MNYSKGHVLVLLLYGLAFADIEKLIEDDLVKDIKGNKWIKTKRKKPRF